MSHSTYNNRPLLSENHLYNFDLDNEEPPMFMVGFIDIAIFSSFAHHKSCNTHTFIYHSLTCKEYYRYSRPPRRKLPRHARSSNLHACQIPN